VSLHSPTGGQSGGFVARTERIQDVLTPLVSVTSRMQRLWSSCIYFVRGSVAVYFAPGTWEDLHQVNPLSKPHGSNRRFIYSVKGDLYRGSHLISWLVLHVCHYPHVLGWEALPLSIHLLVL